MHTDFETLVSSRTSPPQMAKPKSYFLAKICPLQVAENVILLLKDQNCSKDGKVIVSNIRQKMEP